MTDDTGRSQRHPDLDRLAEVEAGEADAHTRAHVDDCADCQGHVAAITAVRAELASLPQPAMPPDVATRIDDALQALGRGTVVPLDEQRGRFGRLPRGGALAGGVAASVIALLATVLVVGHYAGDGPQAGSPTAAENATEGFVTSSIVTTSGHDYTGKAPAIKAALPALLAHDARALASGTTGPLGAVPGTQGGGLQPAPRGSATPKSAASDLGTNPQAARGNVITGAATRLRDNPAALRTCALGLTGEATVPLAVDIGLFKGEPAAVLVFPASNHPDKVDVFVVEPTCPANVFRYYTRLPKPQG